MENIFGYTYGSFILELTEEMEIGRTLGYVSAGCGISYKDSKVYFVIVTGTTAAAKKNEQKIYYVNESAFN